VHDIINGPTSFLNYFYVKQKLNYFQNQNILKVVKIEKELQVMKYADLYVLYLNRYVVNNTLLFMMSDCMIKI